MAAEADWSQVSTDLLELIVRRLDRLPDDYIRFGAVCESWRSVVIRNGCDHLSIYQFPGLMVPDGTDKNSLTRRFLRFNHVTGSFEEPVDSKLQVPHKQVFRGSAYGWLFLTDTRMNIRLFNPFNGAEIQLPSAKTLPLPSEEINHIDKWYVHKAVFSSNPSLQPLPIVLIIHGGYFTPRLAYCKPGDKVWTSLHSPGFRDDYLDAIFYKDQFYALSYPGYIMAYDIGRRIDDNDHSVKTILIAPAPTGLVYSEQMYLVELLDGELIKLTRKTKSDKENNDANDDDDDNGSDEEEEDEDEDGYTDANSDDDDDFGYADADEDTDYSVDDDEHDEGYRKVFNFHTTGFEITKFDASEQKWVEVENLGDNALFLGRNTSFSLPASEYPGCVPNSIYFTSDDVGCHVCEDSGSDIGIYNLTDKSIKSLCPVGYSMRPCPIWVDSRGSTWVNRGSTSPGVVLNHCFGGGSDWIYSKSAPIDDHHHHVSLNQFPGLMVPGTDVNSETRRFLQLNHDSSSFENDCHDQLQVPHGYVCRGSAYGWVFLVGDELDSKLMNPFTGEEIQLPSVTTIAS